MKHSFSMLFFVFMLMTSPNVLWACSVCFGDPSSLQSKALGGAVLFLLTVIGGVLAAIAYLGFSWSRKAKKLSEINGIPA